MKIRTLARAAIIRLCILGGVLIGLTLFINLPWFDEELHEDVAQLLRVRDVPLDGNAYPLVVGFLASASEDPREAGVRIIQAQRRHFREQGHTSMSELPVLADPIPVPTTRGLLQAPFCDPKLKLDCADRMIAAVAADPIDDAQARLLLDRFERLLDEPRYEENQEIDFRLLPSYYGLFWASRVRLAEGFQDADSSRVLQRIGEDIRFWKRILDGGQTLIAKMVALAGLRYDTMFLSTLMRVRELSENDLREIHTVLTPLTEVERNLEETFMAELRIGLLSEDGAHLVPGPVPLGGLLSQEQATINDYYTAVILPLRLRASLSAAEFYRQKAYRPLHYPVRLMPPPLYNFAGKQYLKVVVQLNNWQDYIARVHDMDGRIALVLLQAEIALNGHQNVEDVLQASRYRNPYTGEPMDYDAAAETIGFPCLAVGQEVCAVRIR